jgi:hypothetical protein
VSRSSEDVVVSGTLLTPRVVAVKIFVHDEYESVTEIVVADVSRTTFGIFAEFTTSHGPPLNMLLIVFMAKPVEGVMPRAPKLYPRIPMAATPRVSEESRKATPSAPVLTGLETVN